MSEVQSIAWQQSFWGDSRRTLPWKNIIRRYILEIGDRPDLNESQYNRKVAGKFYSMLPATEQLLVAIGKMPGDLAYGRKLWEKYHQLPAVQIPAPDTIARATRAAKAELKTEGKLVRAAPENDGDDSFAELLKQAEEVSGNYYSGIEARFKLILKQRFSKCQWQENKSFQVNSGPHRGRIVVPDFVCESLGLSIEIDSFQFHKDSDQFINDRQKARIMQGLDYYHLQFSGQELSIPGGFENAIREIEWFIERRIPHGRQR